MFSTAQMCREGVLHTPDELQMSSVAAPQAAQLAARPAVDLQQDADRHLVTHFESVQTISTTTTTPSLLPMLLSSLIRNTDYKALLESLR